MGDQRAQRRQVLFGEAGDGFGAMHCVAEAPGHRQLAVADHAIYFEQMRPLTARAARRCARSLCWYEERVVGAGLVELPQVIEADLRLRAVESGAGQVAEQPEADATLRDAAQR